MKITNKLIDEKDNTISVADFIKNATETTETPAPKKRIEVVFAHTDIVNENRLKLNADSIKITREKYPLLFEHSDINVSNVVGYIETTGKPNEKGEFVGYITFYDTENGKHAERLWSDGVYNELSVGYFVEEYEVMDDLNGGEYLSVLSCVLKEVSIVSVGADRDTGETKTEEEPKEEPKDEPIEDTEDEAEENTVEESEEENSVDETPVGPVENSKEDLAKIEKLREAKLNALRLIMGLE